MLRYLTLDHINPGLLRVRLPPTELLEIGNLLPLTAAEELAHLQSKSVSFRVIASIPTFTIWHMDQELLAAKEEVNKMFLLVLHELDDQRVTILVHVVDISTVLIDEPRS